MFSIKQISELINKNKLEDSKGAFKKYLNLSREKYGKYEHHKWPVRWREEVYDFGTIFGKRDAGIFIEVINELLEGDDEKNEVVEFVWSEILWNWYPTYCTEYLINLIKKYPSNPEFHHSYSHCLEKNGEFPKAIAECKVALKIEPNNNTFLVSCFNKELRYFNILLKSGEYEKARGCLKIMEGNELYEKDTHLHNFIIVGMLNRLDDHLLINKKIEGIDKIVSDKSEEERVKLIEVLGVFAAILSFISVNINIGIQNLKVSEMLSLSFQMACIFLIFAISLSYIFRQQKKEFYKEGKFWVLFFLFGLIFVSIKFI